MNWYIQALQKYAEFNGRAQRSEYWFFVLFNFLITICIIILDFSLGTYGILGTIYCTAVLIPGIAVTVRRLHDTGRSGTSILLIFIPIIGALILLVFLFQDSYPRENAYGEFPK